MSRTDRYRAARLAALVAAVTLATISCNDDKISNSVSTTGGNGGNGGTGGTGSASPPTRRVVGIAELRFDNITSTNVSSSILLATTVADLERLRTAAVQLGNVTIIQLQSIATGEFTAVPAGGTKSRFLRATYGLRNAGTDSALFDPSRENVSFVAVQTAATLPNTDVRLFQRADGSPASSALALQLAPAELMAVDGDGNLITLASDVEATVSDDDVKRTALPTGAAAIVPYSFVVRRFPSTPDLGGAAVAFDGAVTFAFRIPDQPNAQDNPTTISVLFLIVQNIAAAGTP